MMKDYGFVINGLKKAVVNKAADVAKYTEIASMRQRELDAARVVVHKAIAEHEELLDAISTLTPLDRGSVEDD